MSGLSRSRTIGSRQAAVVIRITRLPKRLHLETAYPLPITTSLAGCLRIQRTKNTCSCLLKNAFRREPRTVVYGVFSGSMWLLSSTSLFFFPSPRTLLSFPARVLKPLSINVSDFASDVNNGHPILSTRCYCPHGIQNAGVLQDVIHSPLYKWTPETGREGGDICGTVRAEQKVTRGEDSRYHSSRLCKTFMCECQANECEAYRVMTDL